jgi:hypothetical protein
LRGHRLRNKVFTRDGIAEGNGSTTSVLNALGGNANHYWRWKTVIAAGRRGVAHAGFVVNRRSSRCR